MANTFRETLWFKLGDLPAPEDGESVPAELPIEDRYAGTATREETAAYGLHVGTTQAIGIERTGAPAAADVEMSTLVREMKPRTRLVAIGAGACAAIAAFAMYLI